MEIHSHAIVHKEAKLHKSVEVGPFSLIGPNVEIGEGCKIGPYVNLNHCRIGAGSKVASHTVIGGDPQMLNWAEVPSLVEIGEECDIHELVTIHRSKDEGGATRLGPRCMIMTNTHIGHDCSLGSDVILSTYAGLSGHVEVEDHAIIGAAAGIHQFVRIGGYAMVGGMARIVQDVAPFMLVEGSPADVRAVNAVGMKRKGFNADARACVKQAMKLLFKSGNSLSSGLEKLRALDDPENVYGTLIRFLEGSKRGVTGI